MADYTTYAELSITVPIDDLGLYYDFPGGEKRATRIVIDYLGMRVEGHIWHVTDPVPTMAVTANDLRPEILERLAEARAELDRKVDDEMTRIRLAITSRDIPRRLLNR